MSAVGPANAAEPPRAPAPPRRYELFVTEDEFAFLWQPRDEGVTLSTEGVSWRIGGVERARPWNEIEEVCLNHFLPDWLGNMCTIGFQGGPPLLVLGAVKGGDPASGRDSVYRELVQDLHARLDRPEHVAVRFYVGNEGAAILTKVMLIIAPLFVVGATVASIFAGELLPALFSIAIATIIIWQFWRTAQAHQLRKYSPRDLPHDLLP